MVKLSVFCDMLPVPATLVGLGRGAIEGVVMHALGLWLVNAPEVDVAV